MNIPNYVNNIRRTLEAEHYRAYPVGGCVRDALLGQTPEDWDMTTDAPPEETMRLFGDAAHPTGLRHGTVTVAVEGHSVEVTTMRRDGAYLDHRHPESVRFTDRLEEDLARRDFTVNAMAWSPETGLVDPFDGQGDLNRSILRCVGDPMRRFDEDALRILRALRFSATLDFDIDPPTAQGVHACGHLLGEISAERILIELRKLVCGARAEAVLVEYRDVFEVIMPELKTLSGSAYLLAARRVSLIPAVPELRLAALLCDLTREQAHECGMRLRFSKANRAFIDGMIEHSADVLPTDRVGMRHALNRLGDELLPGLVELRAAQIRALTHMVIQENDCVTLKQLVLNGEDVFKLGVTRRATGTCLNDLLERVMNGEVPNTREALSEVVRASLPAEAPKAAKPRPRRGRGAKAAEPPAPPEE